jgi:hypothetical protein
MGNRTCALSDDVSRDVSGEAVWGRRDPRLRGYACAAAAFMLLGFGCGADGGNLQAEEAGTEAQAVISGNAGGTHGGTFTTLTYNVAGLLEPFSSSNPSDNTSLISCLIRDYDLVQVQEDFNYHAALYDTCDDHSYRSPTSGGMGFGSGLNILSRFWYTDFDRMEWSGSSRSVSPIFMCGTAASTAS